MRRADRLFQITQILRRSTRPVTAAALAEELEVSTRTVYRDVADLMGQRVPIEGEAGLGYLLASEYDMPPLMLTPDEIEAVMLGSAMGCRPLRQGSFQCGPRCDREDRRGRPRASAPLHRRAKRRREADDRGAGGTYRSFKRQVGDPQGSEAAAPIPVRCWRGDRANAVAGDPRLCRDEPLAGRMVRAASGLPTFPHRPYDRGRNARRDHRPAPRRIAPPLAALARDERSLSLARRPKPSFRCPPLGDMNTAGFTILNHHQNVITMVSATAEA
jgi:biotin operon repressor